MKHEALLTLKLRNTLTDTETEVASTNLLAHLRSEMRERDLRHHPSSTNNSRHHHHPLLTRHSSHHGEANASERGRSDVQVLLAQHRSKKSNKYHIVEAAQQRWIERVNDWKNAPIIAIETRDGVLEAIRSETRLSDPDSWRKVIQSVPVGERMYLGQVHELLEGLRKSWVEEGGMRESAVFNFRTGAVEYYDLGL